MCSENAKLAKIFNSIFNINATIGEKCPKITKCVYIFI
jgi:hypothetical protein